MKFTEMRISGAYLIDLEPLADSRGYFARLFCTREFEARGLCGAVVQVNLSCNHRKGVIRGLHYLAHPSNETKLIRCTKGANYHVIVDMRPDSPSYLRHFGVELTEGTRTALYVPAHCAHGYQALTDGSESVYRVSDFYDPTLERGIRFDDPALGIDWPLPASEVSEKDRSWSLLEMPTAHGVGMPAMANNT